MIVPETKRLLFRKFKVDDFSAVHSYASCEENIVYMLFDRNTEKATQNFINHAIQSFDANPITDYHFAVILKENNQLIGGCSIVIADNTLSDDNTEPMKDTFSSDSEAEIGWLVHRDYWKQGYGVEMGREMLRFGFDDLNIHRIIAHCDAENIGSYKIMEKIGMRREGLFWDARPPHKLSNKKYSDELSYAMLKDEWDVQKEIAYYKSLPIIFDDFIDVPILDDGVIRLVCTEKKSAIPEKKWIPSYTFAICSGSEKVGNLSLRIGYGGGDYDCNCYYGGQIGYGIDEAHRGNGYAGRACKLVAPVAKAHNMTKLLITTKDSNKASMRVCEKLGARYVRLVRLPEWTDSYKLGNRYQNIYEYSLE